MSIFRYQNPIGHGDARGIRDAQILRHADKWYLTGTVPGFYMGEDNPGVRLFESDDLLNWRDAGLLIDRRTIPDDAWYRDRFWSPELHQWRGRWYLTFTSCNESQKHYFQLYWGLAVADHITGPYEVLTKERPPAFEIGGGDATLFVEDDDAYALWSCGCLYCSRIDLRNGKLLGEPWKTICHSEIPTNWDGVGIEAPYVVKHDGLYHLFYSSWSRGYEVGHATAPFLKGPWTKRGPVYGAFDQKYLAGLTTPPEHDPSSPFMGAGHNAVFTGPDGQLWLSCHGMLKNNVPKVCIDPIPFDTGGHIPYFGPSYQPREIRW